MRSNGVGYELEVHLRRGAKIVVTKIRSNIMRASELVDNLEALLEEKLKQ